MRGADRDELAESGDHGQPERGVKAAHPVQSGGDAVRLRVRDPSGNRVDRGVVQHLPVGADDAREPLRGVRARRGPAVRGGTGVVLCGDRPEPQMHVRRDRESLGRDARRAVVELDHRCDRLDRRAQRAGIDELPLPQSLGVRAAARDDLAAHDGDDVRGGGADVHEHTVGVHAGHEPRRRRPVRRGHGERLAARDIAGDEASVHSVDTDAGAQERGVHGIEQERHSVTLGAKHLRKLGRHRHGVEVRGLHSNGVGELAEQRRERGALPLDGERAHADRDHTGADDARDLRVHPTDVPADDRSHRSAVRAVPCA